MDDDLFTLSVYQMSFQKAGYDNLSLFYNGATCLENLHQGPTVIFLDYFLDDVNGLDVLVKIKNIASEIFVVLVSSERDHQTILNSFRLGAFDYIIKGEQQFDEMKEIVARIEEQQVDKDGHKPCFICRFLSKY